MDVVIAAVSDAVGYWSIMELRYGWLERENKI